MKKLILMLWIIFFLVSCQKDDENTEIQEPPLLTNAGNDIFNVDEFQVNLDADDLETNEKGVWSIHHGLVDNKVFFDDKNSPKTIFHGLPDEEYKLIWQLTKEGRVATDTITVVFAPMKVEVINKSPDFYRTRLHLEANSYDKGKWSIEGEYHHIWNQNFGGRVIPDEESPHIKFYGYENTQYRITWTTWYGSKSESKTIEFNSDFYHQDEALEDVNVLSRPWRYEKDENGNVTLLNLGGDGYGRRVGSLENYPAMQALTHLKKLDLSGDGFYHFPEVITSKYTKLEVLDLAHNAISSLPENFGNLRELDTLELFNNQDSKSLKLLPDSFGKLTQLRYLNLSGMRIEKLPDSFSNLTSLSFLNLEGNIINRLPSDFGNLKNLEILRGPGLLQDIPNSFSNLEKLKFCFFYINSNTAKLPDNFGELKSLETLWLYGKYESLPDSFTELTKLKDLEITGGSIISKLPENFGNLNNLEDLRIAGDFKRLPNTFGNLVNLKNLTLHGSLEYLPNDIGNLKKLEWLSINNMNLKEIPDSFGDLESLKYFKAFSNDISIIPDSFGNLKNIYEIDLSYNNISHFPSTIGNLSNTLYKLYIRGNNYSEEEFNKLKEKLPNTTITSN